VERRTDEQDVLAYLNGLLKDGLVNMVATKWFFRLAKIDKFDATRSGVKGPVCHYVTTSHDIS
jgi:hypothetical protein